MSLNTLSLGGLDFSNALTAGQHLTVRTGPGDNDFVNVFLGDFRSYMTDLVNQRIDIVEGEVAVPKPSVWPSLRTMTLSGAIGGTVAFDGSVNFTINTTIADGSLTIAKTSGLQALINTKLDATANAVSASKLQTARTIALNGTVVGSGLFDGSGNLSIETQIADGTLTVAQTAGLAAQLASKANHAGQDYTGDHNFKDGKLHVWQKSGENQAVVNFYDASAVMKGRVSWNQTNDNVRLQRYNAAGTAVEGDLAVNATTLTFNGNTVWHTGNLNANTFNYLSSAAVNYASGASANCDTFAAGTKALVHNSNANTPGASSTYWYIETLTTGTDNTNMLQRAWSTSVDEQYFRRYVAGVWGSWRRVWNSFNFDPSSKLNSNANAVSASKLLTPRGISFSGAVSGSFGFDGSSDVNAVISIADGSLTMAKTSGLTTALSGKLDVGAAAADYMGRAPVLATNGVDCDSFSVGSRYYVNSYSGALNTPNPNDPWYIETIASSHGGAIVQRAYGSDGAVWNRIKWVSWTSWRKMHDTSSLNLATFNAATATKLQTARSIAVTGAVSGSANFDGSANISISTSIGDGTLTIAKTSGLQSALDAKLSISDYTAADILTKLKTVDGVGSGLDADLLDGQQGSYYWSMGNFDPANKVNVGGDTMLGKLTFVTGDANKASLNIPHATVAPTTPENGDIWTTTAAMYLRLNGATRTIATTSTWSTVTQIEAEAGAATTNRLWTSERVRQAIAAYAPSKTHNHNSLTGDVTLAGDLLPDLDNVRSLGSPTLMWRDVYIGPGSLYLNGQKVLEDTESGTIVMRADPGQNISIQTYTTGDIELAPQGSGMIQLKGPVMVDAMTLIRSSDGSSILFDDPIEFTPGSGITGELRIDGNVAWHTGNFNPTSKLDATANALSATKLATPRSFSLSGPVTAAGVNFDGTGAVLLNTQIANDALSIAMVSGLQAALNNASSAEHTHLVSEVEGLQSELDARDVLVRSYATNHRRVRPLNAAYQNNASSVTGAFKITLPVTWNNTMVTLRIRGFNHNSRGAWEILVSGYNYIPSSSWHFPNATVIAGDPMFNVVRFAHDGEKCCIILGMSTDVHEYPSVEVVDAHLTFTGASGIDANGWSVSLISAEDGLTFTTGSRPLYSTTAAGALAQLKTVDGPGSGLDADTLDGLDSSVFLRKDQGGNINGAVTIISDSDGILNLRQSGLGGTAGTKNAGWNYIQFQDSEGDRQGYFGISSTGDFIFQPEMTGVVKIGDNVVWHTGTFNPATKLDVTANAVSASTLQTARAIALSGVVTATGVNFDGSGNISLTTQIADNALSIAKTSGLATALGSKIDSALIGVANGVTPLGADAKIPAQYLPSFVDDTVEAANYAALPPVGEPSKIYVTLDNNLIYRWSGSVYVEISSAAQADAALRWTTPRLLTLSGKVSGSVLIDGSADVTLNVTGLSGTKADVGLANVDNTSDLNKPVSTAQASAFALKLDSSVYTSADVLAKIKTVDGVGSGLDADLLDGQHGSYYRSLVNATDTLPVASLPAYTGDVVSAAGGSVNTISNNAVTFGKFQQVATSVILGRATAGIGNVEVLTGTQVKSILSLVKADVGLANVDDTSDLNKPISAATQSALNLKLDATSYTAADILTKVLTVDGVGSGLDADLLDGLNSDSFLRSDVGNSADLRLLASDGRGIRFWGDGHAYKIFMSSTSSGSFGGRNDGEVSSDYNLYFRIGGGVNRGFVFESDYGNKLLSINPDKVRSNVAIEAPSFEGDLSGNAGTATKLLNARSVSLTGVVTAAGVNFDGTGNLALNTVIADNALSIGKTTGLQSALNAKIESTLIGVANGITPLGSDAKIPAQYLPSFVDDTVEASTFANLPATGEASKIYVTLDTNRIYRWSGTVYIEISSAAQADAATRWTTPRLLTLAGKVSGSVLIDGSSDVTLNVTGLSGTKTDVGLGNVDNTSDLNKPVSTAQATAIGLKLDASAYTASDVLTKIKTVDGAASGLDADLLDGQHGAYYLDLTNASGTLPTARLPAYAGHVTSAAGSNVLALTARAVALSHMAEIATGTFLGRVNVGTGVVETMTGTQAKSILSLVRADVGLSNVDNTSDLNKPVSNATQTALNLKLNASEYTASDVLAKLLTVDGVGSGLDADTLDGLNSTSFVRSDVASPSFGNGVSGTNNVLTIVNPGVGYLSGFAMGRTSDHAGLSVLEYASDQTLYEMWMSDNPDSTVDIFSWRFSDWQGVHGTWQPLQMAGLETRFISANTKFHTALQQSTAAFFTTGDASKTDNTRFLTHLNDNGKLKVSGSGTATITALNVSGYTGASGRVFWIRLTGPTTFEWGYNSHATNPVAVQTDIAVSTTPTVLSNGVAVSFSSNTTGVAGDVFGCRIYRKPTATLSDTTVSGTLTVAEALTVGGEAVWHTGNFAPSTKLDAASYSAGDVLSKLLTVDGSSSLLDADLLDGQEGSWYQNLANSTGTLADVRLSSNVPLKNAANLFTGSQTFDGTFTKFTPGSSHVQIEASDADVTAPRIQSYGTKPLYLNELGNAVHVGSGGLTIGGNTTWHAGNFNPATKLDTTANAVSATKLLTARTISGTSFDGTANVWLNFGVNLSFPTNTTYANIPVGLSLASSALEFPEVSYGTVVTFNNDNHRVAQLVVGSEGEEFYWRSYRETGGGWKPMRRVWHSGNFNPDTKLNSNATADAALKLATVRNFSLAGPVTAAAVGFDGSGNVVLNSAIANNALSIAMVSGLQAGLDSKVNASLLGVANGVATLGVDGKVTASQLPSYVDDVLEYATLASFPATGETGKIYLTLDNNKIYRWTGSTYINISDAVSASDTALRWATARTLTLTGKAAGSVTFDGSANFSLNVTSLTVSKADVGLGNVDNTSDLNKPISTATQTALDLKLDSVTYTAADVLTKVKTVDGVGSGLDSDLLDGVEGANYVRADLTYLGRIGPQGSDNVTNTASAWSLLPVGYARFMKGSEITTAGGTPINNWGYFFKSGQRDSLGGWAGIWTGYLAGQNYIGRSASNTELPTWEKIWTDANDGTGSGLDADLLDGQHGSFYRIASNLDSGTLADARLSANVALKNTSNTFSQGQLISAGASTTALEYLALTPTDHGVGKPRIFVKKEATADQWTIGLWDGGSQTGGIDLAATRLTKQGNVIWHAGNDGAASGLDADKLDGQEGDWYQDLANATGALSNARLSPTVLRNNYEALGPDALPVPGFWTDGAGAHLKMYSNSTGSTGFPSEFGATWSFRAQSNEAASNYARAFDLHRANSHNSLYLRFYNGTTGDPGTWHKVWSELNHGVGSGLNADLLDEHHGSWYQDLANATGTLDDARLGGNVAMRNAYNTFTANMQLGVNNAFNPVLSLFGQQTDGTAKIRFGRWNGTTDTNIWGLEYDGNDDSMWLAYNSGGTRVGASSFRMTSNSAEFGAGLTLKSGGNVVWHAGNFNPATKANLSGADFTGGVSTNLGFSSTNPNNSLATFNLNWLNDAPRIRIGGGGVGVNGTFTIQGAGDFIRMSLDYLGNAAFAGTVLSIGGNNVWHAGNFDPATKLDAGTYTAADVKAKLLTVDGAGSNLDADLLDGQHGSYYLDYGNLTNLPYPVKTVSRALPTTVNDCVDIGSYFINNGGHNLRIAISTSASGMSVAKNYDLTSVYTGDTGWLIVEAFSSTGIYGGQDFQLEALQQAHTLSLRVRRTVGAVVANLTIVIENIGVNTDTLTQSSAVTVNAPVLGTYWKGTGLTQVDATLKYRGNVVWHAGTFDPNSKLNASVYTANDVLAKLLGVDGAGTGLDADLLDGQHGSWYQNLSNATGTLADARLSSNVPLKNGGNVFNGTSTWQSGNSDAFTFYSQGDSFAGGTTLILKNDSTITSNNYLRLQTDANGSPINFADFRYNGSSGLNILSPGTVQVNGNDLWHDGTAASVILTKVKTVDGAGSGLDADLLDGQEGSHYLSLNNMTGVLPVSKGGTGVSSVPTGDYVRGNGTGALESRTPDEVRKDIGATAFTMSETAPVNPNPGDEWVKKSTGVKYTWLVDDDSAQWVNLSGSGQVTGPAVQTYIQPQQPGSDQPYVWFQNGLGESGEDITMWINIPD